MNELAVAVSWAMSSDTNAAISPPIGTPVVPLRGQVCEISGRRTSGVTPVVNVHEKSASIGFPAASVAVLNTMASYSVEGSNGSVGSNVAVNPEFLTVPATGFPA